MAATPLIIPMRHVGERPALLPKQASPGSAGWDVHAHLERPMTLKPMARGMVPTGFAMAIPEGFECQVRPRSGLAIKHGITVLNAPGTIDSDYRGEVKVLLVNLSDEPFTIEDGDRVAQLVFAPVTRADFEAVAELEATERGEGGFGSSGR